MSTCTSAGQQVVMDNMFALSSVSTPWPGGARRYKAWARFKVRPDMKLLWCWQRGLSEPPGSLDPAHEEERPYVKIGPGQEEEKVL